MRRASRQTASASFLSLAPPTSICVSPLPSLLFSFLAFFHSHIRHGHYFPFFSPHLQSWNRQDAMAGSHHPAQCLAPSRCMAHIR